MQEMGNQLLQLYLSAGLWETTQCSGKPDITFIITLSVSYAAAASSYLRGTEAIIGMTTALQSACA